MSAGTPIELVRPETAADRGGGDWPVTNWWIMAPLLIVGGSFVLWIQVKRWRAARVSDSERAFRAMSRGVPTKYRVVARELAAAHGSATPAAIVLSDAALLAAASRIEPKPGSTRDRVIGEWLAERGLAGHGAGWSAAATTRGRTR